MDTAQLVAVFTEQFGKVATHEYFAPGRINLIGEHTDYNGGHVFPCAISLGTYAVVAMRPEHVMRLYSANFPKDGVQTINLDQVDVPKTGVWADYVRGMLRIFAAKGYQFDHGLDIYINGDLPDGAGLSSSASLEMLIGEIVVDEYGFDVPMLERVRYGQQVENKYIGVNSGIMDQFAVGMGQRNTATFLDTNTMQYERLPLDLGDNVVLIMNTNKKHQLTNSKYNERRSECETALARLQTKLNVHSLGELDNDTLDEYTYLLGEEIYVKRARHAVSENQRTIRAADALKAGDLQRFGRLVSASGVSLRYDYEVSGVELDTLVSTALEQDGVLGARMIGGGFAGCAIAIVNQNRVEEIKEVVGRVYARKIGYPASFYVAEIADGPHRIEEA